CTAPATTVKVVASAMAGSGTATLNCTTTCELFVELSVATVELWDSPYAVHALKLVGATRVTGSSKLKPTLIVEEPEFRLMKLTLWSSGAAEPLVSFAVVWADV